MSTNEIIRRRALRSSGAAIDWESIARGMLDFTTPFEVPAEVFGDITEIPNSCTPFRGTKATKVTIPSRLTNLRSIFQNNSSIKRVVYEGTNYTFSSYAFQLCSANDIADVLPDGFKAFSTAMFMNSSVKRAEIPEGLTILPSSLFQYSYHLEELVLPSTLVNIAGNALNGVGNRGDGLVIVCKATTPPNAGGLVNTTNILAIYVPDASVDAYKAATNWSTYASKIKPISERPVGGVIRNQFNGWLAAAERVAA